MGSLANIVSSLQGTTNRLITQMATDSAFVLRKAKSSNGKGGTVGAYAATTVTPLDCFYSPMQVSADQLKEEMSATQRRPGTFHKFVFRSDVDVKADDKIRRVAARGVTQADMEIIRVTNQIGVALEVIAFEELPL